MAASAPPREPDDVRELDGGSTGDLETGEDAEEENREKGRS